MPCSATTTSATPKWDHNRDLHEAGDSRTGQPAVHDQTLATYALMDELQRRHPRIEIESCSSRGGRVDLAVLERTHAWALLRDGTTPTP